MSKGQSTRSSRPVLTLGIDGCRAGWLFVAQDLATGNCRAGIMSAIDEVPGFSPVPETVAIDIPIGLPDSRPRLCEAEARRLLGRPRSSSVFSIPPRKVLRASSYAEACRIGAKIDGRKLSRQTWNILPKIKEVDAFLKAHPELREVLWESHPELCFWRLNGCVPLKHSKRTAQGRAERERLVTSYFGQEYLLTRSALLGDSQRPSGWASDDLLDAFAVLWTAGRKARGVAVGVPENPPRDRTGLRMQILS
ncbi:MAG TPA: DUF429 domain-containing protein [Spirochaetia bacterium]|nr:DUF429 domain-containing protein [Spirochaetia bacterium]